MDTAAHPELDHPQTTLLLTRTFAAPRALLFKLWTQPEHIVRWWGCAETGEVDFTNDLRVGGEFSAVMQLANGHTHRITGVYCKIEAPERLGKHRRIPGRRDAGHRHVRRQGRPDGTDAAP